MARRHKQRPSRPHFHDERVAYAFIAARLSPEGPVCPRCGGVERIAKMQGESTRVGAYECYQCGKPFSVGVGILFDDSKGAMHIRMQAMGLFASSRTSMSSNQLHRTAVAEIVRRMGISEQTFYRWKKMYGRLGLGERRRRSCSRRRTACAGKDGS